MSFTNITSGSPETASVNTSGTLYQIQASGNFGGGTLSAQVNNFNKTEWLTLDDKTLTDNGAINIELPSGSELRAALDGSTGADVDVLIAKIK